MFSLEQSISEWRREMLAAGIKTPVPLEELETHLREEIERLTKSGVSEVEAFKTAVQKIGSSHLLKKEFKKVEKGPKIIRAFMLMIGWLAATGTLAYSVLMWDVDWNLFEFAPDWDLGFACAMLGVLAALTAIWFLARASRGNVNRGVSLLLCLLLAGFAVWNLHAD